MFRYAKDVRLASVTPTLTPSGYLISSQGPCSALSAAATLTHFLLLCKSPRWLQICGYHQSAERMLVVVQSFPNFRGPSLANKFNAAPLISLSWHRF